jgi:hypothetical protein
MVRPENHDPSLRAVCLETCTRIGSGRLRRRRGDSAPAHARSHIRKAVAVAATAIASSHQTSARPDVPARGYSDGGVAGGRSAFDDICHPTLRCGLRGGSGTGAETNHRRVHSRLKIRRGVPDAGRRRGHWGGRWRAACERAPWGEGRGGGLDVAHPPLMLGSVTVNFIEAVRRRRAGLVHGYQPRPGVCGLWVPRWRARDLR